MSENQQKLDNLTRERVRTKIKARIKNLKKKHKGIELLEQISKFTLSLPESEQKYING